MIDEEMKQKAEEGMKKLAKDIERDKLIDSFLKFVPFAFVLIIGFLLGTVVMMVNQSPAQQVSSECALRNTAQIYWIPSLITQQDLNENVVGIPICIPIDKNTGQRVKMG